MPWNLPKYINKPEHRAEQSPSRRPGREARARRCTSWGWRHGRAPSWKDVQRQRWRRASGPSPSPKRRFVGGRPQHAGRLQGERLPPVDRDSNSLEDRHKPGGPHTPFNQGSAYVSMVVKAVGRKLGRGSATSVAGTSRDTTNPRHERRHGPADGQEAHHGVPRPLPCERRKSP